MTPDNTIRAANNIEIYEDRIYDLFDEYKDTLSDNDKDCDIMIRNVRYFKGALKHIYLNLFRPTVLYDSMSNTYSSSILDYNDTETLDRIWSIYVSLCYKYGIKPTVFQYGMMTGIQPWTIQQWANGSPLGNIFAPNDRQLSTNAAMKTNIAKAWMTEQENALFDGASQGSIGDIFLLKSVYGYRDNTNITIDSNTTAEERHAIESDLIRRLTTAPDSAIQPRQDQETITTQTTAPAPDF